MDYVVLAVLIMPCLVFFIRSIYWKFDHKGWKENSRPDPNARIIDVSREEVMYEKNGAKYKTTVRFSDGFYYITHKTHRENHFLSYTISVDKELSDEIIETAIEAHKKELIKLAKQ